MPLLAGFLGVSTKGSFMAPLVFGSLAGVGAKANDWGSPLGVDVNGWPYENV